MIKFKETILGCLFVDFEFNDGFVVKGRLDLNNNEVVLSSYDVQEIINYHHTITIEDIEDYVKNELNVYYGKLKNMKCIFI